MHLKTILQSTRPPFLLLTLSCFLLAFSVASKQGDIPLSVVVVVFFAALMAHVSVNVLNEYLDFASGLDLKTMKTPFSGGSGALPDNPSAAKQVLVFAIVAILATAAAGLYLLSVQGIRLLLPGVLGLFIIVFYTRWINRMPWLCLITPGLGFGFLMVAGSYLALVGENSSLVILLSLVPFFLVNNLLLLNQYPDIDADQSVGRNHFPIRYGITTSNLVYLLFLLAAFVVIGGLIAYGRLPLIASIALLPLIPGIYAYIGAISLKERIAEKPQFLAANVMVALLTPFLLSLAIFLS